MTIQPLSPASLLALALALIAPASGHAGLNTNGTWTIEHGDTLYNIARRVVSGSKNQARVRHYALKHSPDAFMRGDPNSLVVGSVLHLPPWSLSPPAAGAPEHRPAPSAPTSSYEQEKQAFKARWEAKRKASQASARAARQAEEQRHMEQQ